MNSTAHWFSWLKSNDKAIIDILEGQTSNLVSATGALVELIATYDNVNQRNSAIKDLEHTGDNIAHSIFDILDKTFVTPFDREDISKLTGAVDEVLDYANGTADRFVCTRFKSQHLKCWRWPRFFIWPLKRSIL